jgi:hypothetical protein
MGKCVVAVASTGIASQLLPGGNTSHSQFGIPLELEDRSTSSIGKQQKKATELRDCDLMIWDEVPMAHWRTIKVVDDLFRLIMDNEQVPFGGKVVLLSGDFLQILPVVEHGGRVDIVETSIKSSPLWNQIHKRSFRQNMRTTSGSFSFAQFLLDIGDANDKLTVMGQIVIPHNFICRGSLIERVFGQDFDVNRPESYSEKVILAPTNEDTYRLNDEVLDKYFSREMGHTYFSFDQALNEDGEPEDEKSAPIDFVHRVTPQGMPAHELKLKKGAIVMLLRNMSTTEGLCNGTRLRVTSMTHNVFEAEILTGSSKETLPSFLEFVSYPNLISISL